MFILSPNGKTIAISLQQQNAISAFHAKIQSNLKYLETIPMQNLDFAPTAN
jgi:hypothetical protein